MSEEPTTAQIEGIKLIYDYIKHLMTLNTGCIVVLATFSGKVLSQPHWTLVAALAMGGFVISIVACLGANLVLAMLAEDGDFKATQGTWQTAEGISFLVAAAAFLFALVCLGSFAIRNFF
jgi:hypothetical protein